MADKAVPHFHNDLGVAVIHVGSKEFMCIGALPPFDHPHVFLDMGADKARRRRQRGLDMRCGAGRQNERGGQRH